MPAWAIITIIIVCVLVAAAAAVGAARELRLIATRRHFGPEFDRLARRVGARKARAEFIERRQRVAALSLHPLPPERQQGFADSWIAAQEQFVEVPSAAVATAAQLVTQVAEERGYAVEDRTRLLADLSVHHAERMDGYRRAERIAANPEIASTEDLRQAMLGYRAMFRDLADSAALSPSAPASTPDSADGGRPAASPGPAARTASLWPPSSWPFRYAALNLARRTDMTNPESAPAIPVQAVPAPTVPSEVVPAPTVPNEVVPVRARASDALDEGPLLGDTRELRAGWQRIKAGFVDDPRDAVGQAAAAVDEAAQRLFAAVRDRRRQIRETWDGDSAADDTEALRLALLRYQALFRHLGGDETAGH